MLRNCPDSSVGAIFRENLNQESCQVEFRPQYAKRVFPEMSSNAPFGVWIHRNAEWPKSIVGDSNRIAESIEDKYSLRSNDLRLIQSWNESFDFD